MPAPSLNNLLMQLRKCCNHPDLITGPATRAAAYPPADVILEQCGKMQLLDRLLRKLHAKGHKVLIFSQVCIKCYNEITSVWHGVTITIKGT